MVQVHHFKVWDPVNDKWQSPSSKRIAESIAELQGEIIPGTAEEVDHKELDDYGRYKPKVYVGYTIKAEPGHYEIAGGEATLSANSTIAVLESLPKSTINDRTIADLLTCRDASDFDLKKWNAVFADPNSPIPEEFLAPKLVVQNILQNEIQERGARARLNTGAKGIGTSAVPRENRTSTLADAGIDKKLSSRAQK